MSVRSNRLALVTRWAAPSWPERALTSLGGAAVVLAVIGGWIQWRWIATGPSWRPDDALAWLLALAGLCTVGLLARRRPSAAWVGLIVTLSVQAYDLAVVARLARSGSLPVDRLALDGSVALAAIAASGAAVAYASSRVGRRSTAVAALGCGSLVALLALAAWAVLTEGTSSGVVADVNATGSSLGRLGSVTRGFLVVTSAFTAIGVLGDVRPFARRVQRRVAIGGVGPAIRPGGFGRFEPWFRALVDELVAGRGASTDAVRTERRRIARDLHAQVVPAIHRAIREVERDGSAERLAGALRAVLDDVDRLVESRHSMILDELGLVPGLEWLAERAEDRSDVRVGIQVVGGAADGRRLPADVMAAAFLVADLALDNVVRHASRASVEITVAEHAGSLELSIVDDGPGIDAHSTEARRGRRGLQDMAAEAHAVGASLTIEGNATGPGTAVTLRWIAG